MVSLLTNNAAMSALRVLGATQKSLGATERQISTGLRVADASDDAAYWSIGTAMRSRVGAIAAVQDSLALSQSIADVTAAALKGIIATAQSIEADIVTASQPGVDRRAIQQSIAAKQSSILSEAKAASFQGVNWLTLNVPFMVTDHLVSTEVHTATSALSAAIDGSQVAATDLSDMIQTSDTDTIVVTGPNGFTNTITSQSGSDWTKTKLTGSSSYSITTGASTLTVNPGSPLAASQINVGPMSFADSGVTQLTADEVSIYNVGYKIQSTWDYTQTYNGSSSSWQDTSNTQRYFFSGGTDTAFAASIPGSVLSPLLGVDVSDAATLGNAAAAVSGTLKGLIAKAAAVGSLQTRIAAQKEFNAALSDALTAGIGSLVDADMSVASTRLQALQTQANLGVQALAIANETSATISKLFPD